MMVIVINVLIMVALMTACPPVKIINLVSHPMAARQPRPQNPGDTIV